MYSCHCLYIHRSQYWLMWIYYCITEVHCCFKVGHHRFHSFHLQTLENHPRWSSWGDWKGTALSQQMDLIAITLRRWFWKVFYLNHVIKCCHLWWEGTHKMLPCMPGNVHPTFRMGLRILLFGFYEIFTFHLKISLIFVQPFKTI